MNKRALMLTAAAAALLSGHAYGATPCNSTTSTSTLCDITTGYNYPLYTGAATSGVTNGVGNLSSITVDTDGALSIGTSPPNAPAVTINSGTSTAPSIVTNSTTISYTGVSYTVGALLEEASVPTTAAGYGTAENWTGEFVNTAGTLDLEGAGTNKTGILIAGGAYYGSSGSVTNATVGSYANTALVGSATTPTNLGVFTGATGVAPTGSTGPTAIDLESGSTVEVQGTTSYGINLIGPTYTLLSGSTTYSSSGGGSLIGDIDIAGNLELTPTTVTSTAATGNVAINIAGWIQPSPTSTTPNPAFAGTAYANCACAMVGNINIQAGGIVSSEGASSEGIAVLGGIQGSIVNSGTIETFGTSSPSTATNASDPEASYALAIGNNVSGGIYNDGPTQQTLATGATKGSISMDGNEAAIYISPTFNAFEQVPITIGGYTDSAGYTYSLLNRGAISASSEDANISNVAIDIVGQALVGVTQSSVVLQDGIFNSGTISSAATTNTVGPTTDSSVTATAIEIGNYVNVIPGSGGTSSGISAALVNSSEAESGVISASVSGAAAGTAQAILINGPSSGGTPGNLTSIFNSGTIEAAASTSTLTVNSLAAIAINDESGTLKTIYNTGTIVATATEIDNNDQLAVAINTSSNTTSSVTVVDQATASNSATIVGDIHFGTLAGTLTVSGISQTDNASVTGNIYFNNATATNDTLTINNFGTVTGEINEVETGSVNVAINSNGTLDLLTSLPTNLNATVTTEVTAGKPLNVGTLNVATGGILKETVSQGYNVDVYTGVSVINAQSAVISDPTSAVAQTLQIAFGSFVSTPGAAGTSSFVLINTPDGKITVSQNELDLLENSVATNQSNAIPYLFTGNICTYNIATATAAQTCTAPEPISSNDSEIILNLSPKPATGPGGLGLTGYALKMFPYANEALVNDNTLGAAMVNDIQTSAEAQAAYASFAPDVSGATRATAISLTDSATNIVAARQRDLRMYANMEGGTTLWGQQFGERLSQGNTGGLTGYNDSGFGFAMGMDEGDATDGRYGGALTFFTGGMSEKEPTSAKTASEYFLLTGYTDWRGTGLFVDTQATVGYGELKGKRFLTLTDPTTGDSVSREADGNRPTELLAGGVTTGGIFNAGGTVFMPQVSLDGLTMREEGYTESNGGDGFDLHVQPYYANSLRAFLGADLRQDFNFGDFYLQPDLRAGYRYDFVDGAVKLKANFASVSSANGQTYDPFTIEGPDPGRGNYVLGAGVATTTGSWSIGLSYDYVRASDGPTEQTGMLTLLGRI